MIKIIPFVYILFLFVFSFFTYLFIDQGFYALKFLYTGYALSNRLQISLLYMFLTTIFFAFYGYFLYQYYKKKITLRNVKIIIGASVLILIFTYPSMLSFDIFNYMTTAKLTYYYGENPYMVMPIEFGNEPFLSYTRAANKYALYGPSWILLTSIPFLFSFGNILLQMYLFKVFVGIFYILTVFVFYKLVKNVFYTLVFALNPLILIETLISGHNDIIMIFFILLAYLFLKQKSYMLSMLFLFLSVLIKYATISLIPIFVFILMRNFNNKQIDWQKIWKYSSMLILVVLLLSPIREELYPWYFIWIFPFVLLMKNRFFSVLAVSITFGLSFYYVPYMYTGQYLLLSKYIGVFIAAGCAFLSWNIFDRLYLKSYG